MATKSHQRPPEDDWAGLAQNLFGINLDKAGEDDDLLNEDLFQVEIPKPPELEPVEPAPSPVSAAAPLAAPASQQPPKQAKAKIKRKPVAEQDPFGAGILEDVPPSEDEDVEDDVVVSEADDDGITLADESDDGLTLPDDFDTEGLTLPADYDDGLTLAPEAAAESSESEAEESDQDAAAEGSEARPRRRRFRKREDAYWDLLENFEWEEISEDDGSRSGERSGFRRGDRGSRRGGDRGRDRGRGDDRPRRDRPSNSGDRTSSREGANRDEAPRSEAPRSERPDSRRRSRDRSESPREGASGSQRDRGSQGRPRRDDRGRRDEPRTESAPPRRTESLATRSDEVLDDFAFGIFEDERIETAEAVSEPAIQSQTDEQFAPSAETDDRLVEAADSDAEELIWGDDDSDVRLTPANQDLERTPIDDDSDEPFDEQSAMPAADRWDESEESSDVRELREDDGPRRRRRRRRRRRSDERDTVPAEGSVFDLNEVLSGDQESPDQIPDTEAEPTSERSRDEESGERRGRRRRRRRPESADRERTEPNGFGAGLDDDTENLDVANERLSEPEPEVVLPQISYGKVPSWEEAIRYLLNPHLVGRNLGPDEEFESLEGDPRGSGGSEPVPTSPPPRRYRRGGGRGRRPPQRPAN